MSTKLFLVGETQEDGSIDYVKSFKNVTWALKYAAGIGPAAVFAEQEVEFSTTPPAAKEPKVVKTKKE